MLRTLLLATALTAYAAPPLDPSPETVVQKQVFAYNMHDLDAFVACYGDAIEFRTMEGGVNPEKGLGPLRTGYADLFKRFPKLSVNVVNRIVQGRFIIDQQVAEGMGPNPIKVTAIYEVSKGKIIRVWFIEG